MFKTYLEELDIAARVWTVGVVMSDDVREKIVATHPGIEKKLTNLDIPVGMPELCYHDEPGILTKGPKLLKPQQGVGHVVVQLLDMVFDPTYGQFLQEWKAPGITMYLVCPEEQGKNV